MHELGQKTASIPIPPLYCTTEHYLAAAQPGFCSMPGDFDPSLRQAMCETWQGAFSLYDVTAIF